MSVQIRRKIEDFQQELQNLQRQYDASKAKLDLTKANLKKEFGVYSEKEALAFYKQLNKDLTDKESKLNKLIDAFERNYL